MLALAVGLIVIGAVLALVVSIMASNRRTVQATRLNQELRAVLAVIADDLRRARAVDDPLSTAMVVNSNPYRAISTATAGCAIYAYNGAVNGPWHMIRLAQGSIEIVGAANRPANCNGGAGIRLGSGQVEITELTFTPTTTSSVPPVGTDENVVRQLTVTVTGRLVNGEAEVGGISRTMSQTVYVRSVGTGT